MVNSEISFFEKTAQNLTKGLKEAGSPDVSDHGLEIGFMVFFERGECDLPTAFTSSKNIDPSQSYCRSKVSAYV